MGDRLSARGEAEGRGAEIDHAGFLRGFLDTDDVGERARNRLVDVDRLTSLQHRQDLLEVHAAVIGLEHHEVDLRAKLLNRVDDLDAHTLEARGVFRDALGALRDILAALGEGMRHAEAGILRGIGRILRPLVKDRRECHHVTGIEADDANLLRGLFGEERGDEDGRDGDHTGKTGEGHPSL